MAFTVPVVWTQITIQRTVVATYAFYTPVKELRTLLTLYNKINSTQSPALVTGF